MRIKIGGKMKRIVYAIFIVMLICTASHVNDGACDQSYVIGDEDVLQISVWGSPELTIQVPVRPDGMITVPPVGDVKATGFTPKELKEELERDLAKYVKSPTVSVVVTAVNSFRVFVLREGIRAETTASSTAAEATSGAITLKRSTSLLQLLAQLGSLQNADLHDSYVMRDKQKLNIDLYRLIVNGDMSQDVQLRPNDIIFISDNFEKRIMVLGEVKTPSVIPYREGMTVLDAILSAGGFTQFANPNSVVIVRKEGDRVRNIDVRLKDITKESNVSVDIPLKPGDRIVVD